MTATNIEWADAVWNPVTGCSKISQGCKHCYAEAVAKRFWKDRKFTDVRIHSERLEQPLHWKRPRRVFVNSMSDLFHVDVPELFILETLAIMALTPHITYLVLTKRPEQARQILGQDKDWAEVLGDAAFLATHNDEAECFVANAISGASKPRGGPMGWPLPNLWLGVSVEDQATADERIPLLLQTPAAVRFVSAEPLLGPVNLEAVPVTVSPGFFGSPLQWHHRGECHKRDGVAYPTLNWVIVGGESGPGARPCVAEWVWSIVQQCQAASVPVFVKQFGASAYDLATRSFDHYEQWVNKARSWIGGTGAICFDSKWRPCRIGADFMRARDEGTFPVTCHLPVKFADRKGADMSEWPEDLQVRQWPEAKI